MLELFFSLNCAVIRIALLIGLGGFIGSVARFLSSMYLTKLFPSSFPYGTFVVNIVGCLLIGLIYGVSEKQQWLNEEWRLFLATGICGGFTTFSAFSIENIKLLQTGEIATALIYITASIALGLLATLGGIYLAKI